MTVKEKRDIKRKLNVINYAKKISNVKKACRYYGISKAAYYIWIERYRQFGEGNRFFVVNRPKTSPRNRRLSNLTPVFL